MLLMPPRPRTSLCWRFRLSGPQAPITPPTGLDRPWSPWKLTSHWWGVTPSGRTGASTNRVKVILAWGANGASVWCILAGRRDYSDGHAEAVPFLPIKDRGGCDGQAQRDEAPSAGFHPTGGPQFQEKANEQAAGVGRRGRLLRKWREGVKMAPSSKSERNSGAGSGGGGPGGAGGKRAAGRRREHVLKQLERVKVRPGVWEECAGGCGGGTRKVEGGKAFAG